MPKTKKKYKRRKQVGGSSRSSLEEKASHPDYKNPVQLLLDCWSKNTKLTYSEALILWPPLARIPTKELPLKWRGHVRQTSNRPPPVPPRRRRQRSKKSSKKKASKSPKKKGSKSPKKKGSRSPKKKAAKSKKRRSPPPIPSRASRKTRQELADANFARKLARQQQEEEKRRKEQEAASVKYIKEQGWS